LLGGEESAGATFVQRNGDVWTTDKDGIVLALLACEMTAVMDQTPSEYYGDLTRRFGDPVYARINAAANAQQKAALKRLSPESVKVTRLGGEKVLDCLTSSPSTGEPFGGLKVIAPSGWFAIRPSGTEDVSKIYAESFQGADHLAVIQQEARELLSSVITEA
jgi:phosphoglucomutase